MIRNRLFTLLRNTRPLDNTVIRQIKHFGHGREKPRTEYKILMCTLTLAVTAGSIDWIKLLEKYGWIREVSAESITDEDIKAMKLNKKIEMEKHQKHMEADENESSREEDEGTDKKKKKKARIGFRDRKVDNSVI